MPEKNSKELAFLISGGLELTPPISIISYVIAIFPYIHNIDLVPVNGRTAISQIIRVISFISIRPVTEKVISLRLW